MNELYVLYHIPGKKIGVTNNLDVRVTEQQGYEEHEYEILDASHDIDYISEREMELQKKYGYKVDRQLYSELNKKIEYGQMNINVTEQTTTFPCPIKDLKKTLEGNTGMSWSTDHGQCLVTDTSIVWIMNNVKTSMYNEDRCYVYNKAFTKFFDNNPMRMVTMNPKFKGDNEYRTKRVEAANETNWAGKAVATTYMPFDDIREWARTRGIYDSGDTKTQFAKLMEESGELARAILKNDSDEFVDAIGDMVVVLTNLAELGGHSIEHCIASAYAVISQRQGSMVNGTFVKETL
jgi:NTP pyrophosphatase (non-canonical NTP hydrolase)